MATRHADMRRENRRCSILEAAQSLFLSKGYEATTLSDIVSRSGGSLATLYDLFGDKPGLLKSMVEQHCAQSVEMMEQVALAEQDVAGALRKIAEWILERLSDPAGVALLRVIIAEVPRQPELGRVYYEAGPAACRRRMAAYLACQAERGALHIPNPEAAATLFFHMLVGERQMRSLCGLAAETGDDQRQEHVEHVIDAFVRLHSLS